jgi:hypothetical protein
MISRRAILGGAAATCCVFEAQTTVPQTLIDRHDRYVDDLISKQVVDPKSRYRGAIADAYGLYAPGTVSGIIDGLTSAYVCPGSKHHKKQLLLDRIDLAVQFVNRILTPDGNIFLPVTNFNSPPDTAFFMINIATALHNARQFKAADIDRMILPLTNRCGEALIKGGMHTPNHRWVACGAMAQINALEPDSRYVKRIDQWLSEGVDINADGQFSEQSVGVYSSICDRAFVFMADKLKRPALLNPVRENLNSLLYLLHPGLEVVTEVSVRQDRNTRVSAGIYWFPAKYLALTDNDGRLETLTRESGGPGLSQVLEFPQLLKNIAPKPIPTDYKRHFKAMNIVRFRRDGTSATIQLSGQDRFFSLRRGDAIINAFRFASAFFGKGQFVPSRWKEVDGGYLLEQDLEGPYFQSIKVDQPIIHHDEWTESKKKRQQTEVCKLTQSAFIKEEADGFSIRVRAYGTDMVPVTAEIGFAAGGEISGAEKVKAGWILAAEKGTFRVGKNQISFGPGRKENTYVEVRGAMPKLEGDCVFLTGETPFDATIRFQCSSL